MQVPHCLKAAVPAERLLNDRLKCFLLKSCGKRCLAAQQLVRQIEVEILRILRVVERMVNIRRSVIESRKHETNLRHRHHPVPLPVFEHLLCRGIGKCRLRKIDRADRALEVAEHGAGRIQHLDLIRRLPRNIIVVVQKKDQIVFAGRIAFDDLIIESIQKLLVLQLAFRQAVQKCLRPVLLLALHRKVHVDQIFSQRPGQGFAEDFKVLEHLLFLQTLEHLRERCNLLFLDTDVAACNAGEGILLHGQLFLDL